jgi:hypothetical protein
MSGSTGGLDSIRAGSGLPAAFGQRIGNQSGDFFKTKSIQVSDTPVLLEISPYLRTKLIIQNPYESGESVYLGGDNTVTAAYGTATRGLELKFGMEADDMMTGACEVWAVCATGKSVWLTIAESR